MQISFLQTKGYPERGKTKNRQNTQRRIAMNKLFHGIMPAMISQTARFKFVTSIANAAEK